VAFPDNDDVSAHHTALLVSTSAELTIMDQRRLISSTMIHPHTTKSGSHHKRDTSWMSYHSWSWITKQCCY